MQKILIKMEVAGYTLQRYILPDEKGILKEFPAQTRDDQVDQIPSLKKKFLTYKEFGKATFTDIFTKDDLKTH